MLKDTKESIEWYSHNFSAEDISYLGNLFSRLSPGKTTPYSRKQLDAQLSILETITELQHTESFYLFCVEDTWAEEQSGLGSGVNLYLRRGDRLEDIYASHGADATPQLEEMKEYLLENNITKLYTGKIVGDFLGWEEAILDEDGDTVRLDSASEYTNYFKEHDIQLTTLEKLL